MKKRRFFALILLCFAQIFNACEDKNKPLELLSCDLNVKDCTYTFKDKEIRVFLSPKPLQAMDITYLRVENLDAYEDLKLKIYGLNMFLGEIKPKLKRLENGVYESKIVLSSCILDIMRFRAEFLQEDKPIGFYFDFDVKR